MADSSDRRVGSDPAISVVVRTIGNPARLAEALASLATQTRSDFEVVVVDMSDGASDRVLEEYASRLPAVRRITSARMSRPEALNAGIARASAAVIGILDDDNLYDPEQLAILLWGLEASSASFVYTGVRHATYSLEGQRVSCRDMSRPFVFEDLIMGNFIYATGSAFRKSLWERLGGYDERLDVFEDWDFIIRAAQSSEVVHLPAVTGESRKFTGSEEASNFHREVGAVRRSHGGIVWKNRRLYLHRSRRTRFRLAFAAHCEWRPRRRRLLALSVRGWPLELFADLLAWFAHDLRMRIFRRSASSRGQQTVPAVIVGSEVRA